LELLSCELQEDFFFWAAGSAQMRRRPRDSSMHSSEPPAIQMLSTGRIWSAALGLLFWLPDGEEWRTAMVNLPVFPFQTPQAFKLTSPITPPKECGREHQNRGLILPPGYRSILRRFEDVQIEHSTPRCIGYFGDEFCPSRFGR
jgi:hypothetical protein